MKILIIGNGGREHALAYGIYNSKSFKESASVIYVTIGNPGINKLCTPIDIKPTDIGNLIKFAKKEKIDLTVVGPEIPLAMGIVDEFEKNKLKIFGPDKKSAEIESSKIFTKNLLQKYGIPTAKYKVFNSDNTATAISYIATINYPVVIKADGLAAGKGVIIAGNKEEAGKAIKDLTEEAIFGEAGRSFVIEEFLSGYELSLFVITDGINYVCLPYSQDHKKIGEGDTGKNTGGMGAYAPADKLMDDILHEKIEEKIIKPVLKAMDIEGRKYKGCLYCGLMICGNPGGEMEPYVIEFNCRFGDPEAQAVIPLVKSDFLEMLMCSAEGRIKEYKLEVKNKYACCVVLASAGYPDNYETGKIISGLDNTDCPVFHSGTKEKGVNVITNGGRVLSVVGLSVSTMAEAIRNSYRNVAGINFENKYYRKDIAKKYTTI